MFFLYLKSAELLSFIAGNLCIDEFGEKKFSQQGTLKCRTQETATYEASQLLICTVGNQVGQAWTKMLTGVTTNFTEWIIKAKTKEESSLSAKQLMAV